MSELKATSAVCTVTMISKSCGVTAGHCLSTFKYVQFNTPESSDSGIINMSEDIDTYQIDESSSVTVNNYRTDWGVIKVLPNNSTGLFAGDAQGFYTVNTETKPSPKTNVSITGYGSDGQKNERHFAQKEDHGEIERVTKRYIYHTVDTTGGNSGSAIINSESGEIIGIHTNGGCYRRGGTNKGSIIYGNKDFINAINKCLESE
jgi:V8-like Glu-specific endopeptidase